MVIRYLAWMLLFVSAVEAAEAPVMRIASISELYTYPGIIDVLEKAYAITGHQVQFITMPAKHSLYETDHQQWLDAEAVRTREAGDRLNNYIRIPVPVHQLKISAFVRDRHLPVNGWKSLRPYKIVTVRGYVTIEHHLAGYNLVLMDNDTQALKMLDTGRVDVAVTGKQMGESALTKIESNNIHLLDPPLATLPLYHYLNEKHWALVPELTAAIRQVTGTMK